MRDRKWFTGFAIILLLALVGVGLITFLIYRTHGIPLPPGTQEARSSVSILLKDRNVHVVIDNKRFTVVDFSPSSQFLDPEVKHLLLLESFRSDRQDGVEGQFGSVTVEASQISMAGTGRKVWRLQEDGDEGRLDGERFYKVVKFGCCDAPDVYSYFFLGTGQKVYTSVTPLYGIVVPNASNDLTRYIAYDYPTGEDSDGYLQYGSDTTVSQRVVIKTKRDVGVPKIKVEYQGKSHVDSPLMLWGVDGRQNSSALSDFVISLEFYGGRQLRFPVINDQIDLKSATVPADFSASFR